MGGERLSIERGWVLCDGRHTADLLTWATACGMIRVAAMFAGDYGRLVMADRITRASMARALAHYAATLAGHGIMDEERAARITWGAFYGQVLYVVSGRDDRHVPVHDVPGFVGSGGSGFLSLREGYDRVLQSWHTVVDAFAAGEYDEGAASRVRAAVLAAHGVTA